MLNEPEDAEGRRWIHLQTVSLKQRLRTRGRQEKQVVNQGWQKDKRANRTSRP